MRKFYTFLRYTLLTLWLMALGGYLLDGDLEELEKFLGYSTMVVTALPVYEGFGMPQLAAVVIATVFPYPGVVLFIIFMTKDSSESDSKE